MGLQRAGEQSGQGGQDGPVWPGEVRSGYLAAQYCDFMAQNEDLDVFGRGAAGG